MVNAFKMKPSLNIEVQGRDMVKSMLARLCKEIQEIQYCDRGYECDLQLFIVHIDGELLENDSETAEKNIMKKIGYVLGGYKTSHIKSTLAGSLPELKVLACIPIKELENWLIPLIKLPKLPGGLVDDIPSAKERINENLGCDAKDEEKADTYKADLVESIDDFVPLSYLSPSLLFFVKSAKETIEYKKGSIS